MEWIIENQELLVYISIPLTCSFVGWITNLIALKMTFYPLTFWGIPPFLGWQGIIPRKAVKMATKSVDMLTTKLIKVEEIFERVDPETVSNEISEPLEEISSQIVNDIGESTNHQVWSLTPQPIKDGIYSQVKGEVKPLVSTLMTDIKRNIIKLFDLKKLVIQNLTGNNVTNLVDMFQRCGSAEFKFIEMAGLYFGFLFGLLQVGVWAFYNEPWTLPVIGVIVGYITNWLALQMIFRPHYETSYLGIKYQGLFLKRQKEVSKEYSALVAQRILNARNINEEILYGTAADEIFKMIQNQITSTLNKIEGFTKPLVNLILGTSEYNAIRKYVIGKITDHVPKSMALAEEYMDKAMNLEDTIYSRLSELPPEEFEELLRTAFQEDEIILIMVGAALGCLIGLAQMFVVMSL